MGRVGARRPLAPGEVYCLDGDGGGMRPAKRSQCAVCADGVAMWVKSVVWVGWPTWRDVSQ